jgi:hypothetical protein
MFSGTALVVGRRGHSPGASPPPLEGAAGGHRFLALPPTAIYR